MKEGHEYFARQEEEISNKYMSANGDSDKYSSWAGLDKIKAKLKAEARKVIAKTQKEAENRGITVKEYVTAKNNGTLDSITNVNPVIKNLNGYKNYIFIAIGGAMVYFIYKKLKK